jgi:hypothetical protein
VNCHQLFTHQMIRPAIQVANGTAPVPEAPGLGVALDDEAVERFRIEPLKQDPYPAPNLLLAIRWPSGATSYYAHTRQYWDDFENGRLPLFPKGVYLERVPDNGSREWKEMQARAALGGVHSDSALEPKPSRDQGSAVFSALHEHCGPSAGRLSHYTALYSFRNNHVRNDPPPFPGVSSCI